MCMAVYKTSADWCKKIEAEKGYLISFQESQKRDELK